MGQCRTLDADVTIGCYWRASIVSETYIGLEN